MDRMERYNIFNLLHKGLQSQLTNTLVMLRQTDFSRTAEAQPALRKVHALHRLFNDQSYLEDKWLLPVIVPFAPAVSFILEQDHQDNRLNWQRLKGLMIVYDHAVSSEEKLLAGNAIISAFTELVSANMRHMSREEEMINDILWEHYTDAEIFDIEQDIMAFVSPDDTVIYNSWMIHQMDNTDFTGWLLALEKTGDMIFQALSAHADQEFSVLRRQKLLEVYSGVMVA
jgi:hypothetical protein